MKAKQLKGMVSAGFFPVARCRYFKTKPQWLYRGTEELLVGITDSEWQHSHKQQQQGPGRHLWAAEKGAVWGKVLLVELAMPPVIWVK